MERFWHADTSKIFGGNDSVQQALQDWAYANVKAAVNEAVHDGTFFISCGSNDIEIEFFVS